MLKFRKITSAILAASTLGAMLSICGGSMAAKSVTPKASAPTTITVAFMTFGNMPANQQKVFNAINAIAEKQINVKYSFLPISMGAWQQQTNLMLASDEKLDLLFGFASTMTGYIANGQIIPMTKYLNQYGKDIVSSVGKQSMRCGQLNGQQYAAPVGRYYGNGNGVAFRTDLAKKYGINISKITSYNSLESALLTVKKKAPSMYPLVAQTSGSTLIDVSTDWDPLGDSMGVLMHKGDSLKVVNLYEQPEYKSRIQLYHKWYNEGLVMKDITTNTDAGQTLIKSNKAFAELIDISEDTKDQALDLQQSIGYPMTVIQFERPYVTTASVQLGMWMLARNTKTPEKAVQALNLMYKNSDIMNALYYGVKNTDYKVVKNKAGKDAVTFPAGVDTTTNWFATFGNTTAWEFGNQNNRLYPTTKNADFLNNRAAWNNTKIYSKALGFSFDASKVPTVNTALSNVYQEYSAALNDGVSDPNSLLPQFIAKLKANGLATYMAEKQSQLTKWAKVNGVK